MSTVRTALLYSFIERYFSVLLALGSSIVLARLLTPEEFGIYSVALAVMGLAHVLRDFGIAHYLIQARDLTPAHLRTALGVALLIGWTLAALILLTASGVGEFYGEPRMTGVMQVVALNFALLPLCTVSLALLRREMRFKPLMLIQSGAALVNTVVTLALAASAWGPQSMAWGSVAGSALTGLAAWWTRPDRSLLLPGWRHWREVVRFGSQNAGAGLVTAVAMDINDLVVGKVLGFAPVALLSRAQGLMNLFHRDAMGAVRNVAYPAFCQAHREGLNLEALHLKAVAMITAVGWPFYGFVALQAHAIVDLLYGPQWAAAADLVPIFCAAGAAVLHSTLVLSAITAAGRNDLVARFEVVFQSGRAAVIVVAALWWQSVTACALAFLLAYAVQAPLAYRVKALCLPHDAQGLGLTLRTSAGVTACTLAVPLLVYITGPAWSLSHPWASLFLHAGVCAVAWGAAIKMLNHPMAQEPAFNRLFGWWPWGARQALG